MKRYHHCVMKSWRVFINISPPHSTRRWTHFSEQALWCKFPIRPHQMEPVASALKKKLSGINNQAYTGAGHIIRISSKSWFISLIPFKKWNLYNVYIHSTQADIFQVFISFNFDDYNWQLMKTPNSVSQKIRILWKGSILKTPGATL